MLILFVYTRYSYTALLYNKLVSYRDIQKMA